MELRSKKIKIRTKRRFLLLFFLKKKRGSFFFFCCFCSLSFCSLRLFFLSFLSLFGFFFPSIFRLSLFFFLLFSFSSLFFFCLPRRVDFLSCDFGIIPSLKILSYKKRKIKRKKNVFLFLNYHLFFFNFLPSFFCFHFLFYSFLSSLELLRKRNMAKNKYKNKIIKEEKLGMK